MRLCGVAGFVQTQVTKHAAFDESGASDDNCMQEENSAYHISLTRPREW